MQMIANFAGQSESATILTGAFMEEREVLNRASSNRDALSMQLVQVHICKLTLATFFGDFELARDHLRKFELLIPKNGLHQPIVVMALFFGGIALLSSNRPEVRKAKGKLRHLKNLCRHAPSLHASKICLLEAELAVAAGNATRAMEKFHTSIALSQREMVLHEQALACERMSLFLRKEGNIAEAIYYLNEAKSLYQTWGGVAKVRQLDEFLTSRHATVKVSHHESTLSVSRAP
jgi:tetratricopeptide (TPR) repeat protein